MTGRERMITATRAGAIYMMGNDTPRCLSVFDNQGRDVTGPGRVDLATAVRALNDLLKADAYARGHGRYLS